MHNNILVYDDVEIDFCFPPHHYSVAGSDNDEFLNLFAYSPLKISGDKELGLPSQHVVRPIHHVMVGSFQPQHAAFAWPTGVLHAKEKMTMTAPVYAGEKLESRSCVKTKYIRNEKRFVVLEMQIKELETITMALTVERTLVWPK